MRICIVGGICDKPAEYRHRHSVSPETLRAAFSRPGFTTVRKPSYLDARLRHRVDSRLCTAGGADAGPRPPLRAAASALTLAVQTESPTTATPLYKSAPGRSAGDPRRNADASPQRDLEKQLRCLANHPEVDVTGGLHFADAGAPAGKRRCRPRHQPRIPRLAVSCMRGQPVCDRARFAAVLRSSIWMTLAPAGGRRSDGGACGCRLAALTFRTLTEEESRQWRQL